MWFFIALSLASSIAKAQFLDPKPAVEAYLAQADQSLITRPRSCLSLLSETESDGRGVVAVVDNEQPDIPLARFSMQGTNLMLQNPLTGRWFRVPGRDPGRPSLYRNQKYGFTISYPSNLFHPPFEADNGDGITLDSVDGHAKALVYATNFPAVMDWSIQDLLDQELLTSQRIVKEQLIDSQQGYFILSGTEGDKTFYVETYLINGQQFTLAVEYSSSHYLKYSDVVGQLMTGFIPR